MSDVHTRNRPLEKPGPEDRQTRLAAALRANLKRRREQKRARAGDDASDAPVPPEDT
jgi:hypothetical protein